MRTLSPRELAQAIGVSESSLKRWIDSGRIHASRTEGGHRRIAVAEAIRFIRSSGSPLERPDLLDLPDIAASDARAGDGTLFDLLVGGDARAVRGALLTRYLAGASVAELCDGPIRDAMHAIGERWRHDEDGIFVEHRATDACLQALAQLRATIAPAPDAPVALGATPEDDPYLLPSFMAATVVAEAGLRAVNLGPDTPLSAMQQAFEHHAPRLVWLSASATVPPARARAIGLWLASLPPAVEVIVGGRRVDPIARQRGIRVGDSMADLASLAAALARPASPAS